jgi:hypothetical protein
MTVRFAFLQHRKTIEGLETVSIASYCRGDLFQQEKCLSREKEREMTIEKGRERE